MSLSKALWLTRKNSNAAEYHRLTKALFGKDFWRRLVQSPIQSGTTAKIRSSQLWLCLSQF